MSNWLKATQRRVKEGFFQAVGLHHGTEDQEFDARLNKFITFTKELEKLNVSMMIWVDCMDMMCTSAYCISENLSRFCSETENENEPLKCVALAFQSVETDINDIVRKNIKSVFIDRCVKPIESILSIVPLINEKVSERKNSLLDYDFYKSKQQSELSNGKDLNHPNVIKITHKLNEADKNLESITNIIVEVIDEVMSFRPKMLEPELAAMVACMQFFSTTTSSMLSQIVPLIPQSASTTCLLSSMTQTSTLPHKDIVKALKRKLSSTNSGSDQLTIPPVYTRATALGGSVGGYGHIDISSVHKLTHGADSTNHSSRPSSYSQSSAKRLSSKEGIAFNTATSTSYVPLKGSSSRQAPIKLGATNITVPPTHPRANDPAASPTSFSDSTSIESSSRPSSSRPASDPTYNALSYQSNRAITIGKSTSLDHRVDNHRSQLQVWIRV
jgi:hypothetical protein